MKWLFFDDQSFDDPVFSVRVGLIQMQPFMFRYANAANFISYFQKQCRNMSTLELSCICYLLMPRILKYLLARPTSLKSERELDVHVRVIQMCT